MRGSCRSSTERESPSSPFSLFTEKENFTNLHRRERGDGERGRTSGMRDMRVSQGGSVLKQNTGSPHRQTSSRVKNPTASVRRVQCQPAMQRLYGIAVACSEPWLQLAAQPKGSREQAHLPLPVAGTRSTLHGDVGLQIVVAVPGGLRLALILHFPGSTTQGPGISASDGARFQGILGRAVLGRIGQGWDRAVQGSAWEGCCYAWAGSTMPRRSRSSTREKGAREGSMGQDPGSHSLTKSNCPTSRAKSSAYHLATQHTGAGLR